MRKKMRKKKENRARKYPTDKRRYQKNTVFSKRSKNKEKKEILDKKGNKGKTMRQPTNTITQPPQKTHFPPKKANEKQPKLLENGARVTQNGARIDKKWSQNRKKCAEPPKVATRWLPRPLGSM